jgi:glycosyltransferase involved in cell wall biosynthesis
MKTLGISMIVRNESAMIRTCLESVKEADEIVIVDTGSADNTVEICKEYTSKVYSYTGCNDEEGRLADFSDARNHSLDKCTTDYVLIIDADERLVDSIKGIKHVLNSGKMGERLKDGSSKYFGMSMIVETKTEKLHSLRIFRRQKEIRYIYSFHNQLAYSGNSEIMRHRTYKSNFKIESGYSPAHLKDPDRTLRMIENHLKKEPDSARSLYYIGREYLSRHIRTGLTEEGLVWLDKTIEAMEHMDKVAFFEPWTNEYADALFILSNCYLQKLVVEKKEIYWYYTVACASKCVLILPTAKAPMKLLAQLMVKTPAGVPHRHGIKFWAESAKNATNEDVAFLRDVQNIYK